MTKEELISFEDEIADLFNTGKIRSPIHLYSGNEEKMIELFSEVKSEDWVCCSWRSHYQCLLKGVPKEELRKHILSGQSIALCFPEYKIISSAIVGGILPIATGIAMSLRLSGNLTSSVHCFVGDMTAETGTAHECIKYSKQHLLPIRWIVEDNGLSTFTPTLKAWNLPYSSFHGKDGHQMIRYYQYSNKWPHSGAGKFVKF